VRARERERERERQKARRLLQRGGGKIMIFITI
jgi:hypothetical protein